MRGGRSRVEEFQNLTRGSLFGFFLAFARPDAVQLPPNRQLNLEHLVVIRTILSDDRIPRHAAKFFLGILLQLALVVLGSFAQHGLYSALKTMQDYAIHL